METDYTIHFDGGSKNNQSPDREGYGSYRIVTRHGETTGVVTEEYGKGVTNNQAEHYALISALADLDRRITRTGRRLSEFSIKVVGDSNLVLHQVAWKTGQVFVQTDGKFSDQKPWKAKSGSLLRARNRTRAILQQFKSVELVRVPRDTIVAILGH